MALVTKKTTRWLIWVISAIFGLGMAGYAMVVKYGPPPGYYNPIPTVSPTPSPSATPDTTVASPSPTVTPHPTPAP
jgi:hypothetical protein